MPAYNIAIKLYVLSICLQEKEIKKHCMGILICYKAGFTMIKSEIYAPNITAWITMMYLLFFYFATWMLIIQLTIVRKSSSETSILKIIKI